MDGYTFKCLKTTSKTTRKTIVDFVYENFWHHGKEPISTLLTEPGEHPFPKATNAYICDELVPGNEEDEGKICCVFLAPGVDVNSKDLDAEHIAAYLDGKIQNAADFLTDVEKGPTRPPTFCQFWPMTWDEFVSGPSRNSKRFGKSRPNTALFDDLCKMGQKEFYQRLVEKKDDRPILFIKQQCTSAAHTKKGLGTKIAQEMLLEGKSRGVKHVLVEATGKGTHKIYSKLGFEEIGSVDYREVGGELYPVNATNITVAATHEKNILFYLDLSHYSSS